MDSPILKKSATPKTIKYINLGATAKANYMKNEKEQELETNLAAEAQEVKKTVAQMDQQFHNIGDIMAKTAQIFKCAHRDSAKAKKAICFQPNFYQ